MTTLKRWQRNLSEAHQDTHTSLHSRMQVYSSSRDCAPAVIHIELVVLCVAGIVLPNIADRHGCPPNKQRLGSWQLRNLPLGANLITNVAIFERCPVKSYGKKGQGAAA